MASSRPGSTAENAQPNCLLAGSCIADKGNARQIACPVESCSGNALADPHRATTFSLDRVDFRVPSGVLQHGGERALDDPAGTTVSPMKIFPEARCAATR